jgi:hypothetical protein
VVRRETKIWREVDTHDGMDTASTGLEHTAPGLLHWTALLSTAKEPTVSGRAPPTQGKVR